MRGLAALLVLIYHVDFLRSGFAGVDIFFVISGFIISKVGTGQSASTFFANRLIRIVPLYWTVTLLMCAVSLIPGAFHQFTFSLSSLLKSLFFIPYSDQSGNVWPLLVPGWTLNYEMFFYIVFAACLAAGRTGMVLPLLLIFVGIGAASSPADPILQTYTNPILLEFAAGVALARMSEGFRSYSLGMTLLAVGAVGMVLAAFVGVDQDPSRWMRILCLGLPAIALVAGALSVEQSGEWTDLPSLQSLGDASYSLYLLHGLVIAFTHKFLRIPLLESSLAIGLSLLVSLLSYRYFERNVTKWLKERLMVARSVEGLGRSR